MLQENANPFSLDKVPFGSCPMDIEWLREVQAWWDQLPHHVKVSSWLTDELMKSDLITPSDEDVRLILWAFEVLNKMGDKSIILPTV